MQHDNQPPVALSVVETHELLSWLQIVRETAKQEIARSGIDGTINARFDEIERMCQEHEHMQPSREQLQFITAILVIVLDYTRTSMRVYGDDTMSILAAIAGKFHEYSLGFIGEAREEKE